jgi:hypothetical protein
MAIIVKLPAILEIGVPDDSAHPEAEARLLLDAFRAAVLPAENYGIVIHQPHGLVKALESTKAALNGDSNDAEHDALLLLADALALEWAPRDDEDS